MTADEDYVRIVVLTLWVYVNRRNAIMNSCFWLSLFLITFIYPSVVFCYVCYCYICDVHLVSA